jgi:hypothetical protein
MSATTLQLVRPAGARHEALLLLAATVLVLGILGLYVQQRVRSAATEPLQQWQVSAFDELTGVDQAIYNALYTAKDEIVYIYDDINLMNAPGEKFRWPSPADLQQYLLPPFYRDGSWTQNGSMQWSLHEPLAEGEMQGSVLYLGTDGRVAGQGSFLLVVGHVHAGFQNNNSLVVWWNPQTHVETPQNGFRDGLILQGWREVVPHSGAQEVRRIFGPDPPDGDLEDEQQNAEEFINDFFAP